MQNYSFIQLICINLEQKRGIIVYNYVANRILFIILHAKRVIYSKDLYNYP